MADDQITLPAAWHPSVTQQEVAEYLAAGYSQNRTSMIVTGVTLRTIQRWWAEVPEFRVYVQEVRAELIAGQRPMFETTVSLAQQIVLGALTGEYPADDPRVGIAREVLRTTVWRIATPGVGHVMPAATEPPRQLPGGSAA